LDGIVKNAPAGSDLGIAAMKSAIAAANKAYDSLSKAAKQMTEATQSNLQAVAKQSTDGARKARK
ncbi:MAG TPA: phasin family protein, partial [Burkholderiales bacterium]|nr:phasin family protein [Burkholderiales bacterium]